VVFGQPVAGVAEPIGRLREVRRRCQRIRCGLVVRTGTRSRTESRMAGSTPIGSRAFPGLPKDIVEHLGVSLPVKVFC